MIHKDTINGIGRFKESYPIIIAGILRQGLSELSKKRAIVSAFVCGLVVRQINNSLTKQQKKCLFRAFFSGNQPLRLRADRSGGRCPY